MIIFKALKVSTLNSMNFHTFPGSVRTLLILTSKSNQFVLSPVAPKVHIW